MKNKPSKKKGACSSVTKKKIRNDIILVSSLILLVLVAALSILLFRTEGDTVTVTVDGKLYGEYPLNQSRSIEIRNGNGYNLLIIENGKAYVELANCPDGICSSHRPVEHNGESIICLPNKVVIEVHKKTQEQPDIIT